MIRSIVMCPMLFLVVGSTTARAELSVEATVAPLLGSFRYDISIRNSTLTDVILVSIVDAPLADPLIDPSLTAPEGFMTSYDAGLGIVDFLEDANLFAVGTTTSGFSFESLADPQSGLLRSFEALDVNFDLITGEVQTTVIPEPENWFTWTVLAMFCLIWRRVPRSPAPGRLSTAVNPGAQPRTSVCSLLPKYPSS